MQLIERADENDGFQILDLMRKSTSMFSKATSTSDFVDQDKELKKITYKFVEFGVHAYIQSYRRQLRLFVEMGSSFQLPEEYNAQRMIAHLAARCLEFKDCADDFADAVRDGKATYTYAMVEQRFAQCEKRNHLGPKNRGERIPASKLSPDTRAMLVRPPVEEMKQPPRRSEEPKRKPGPYKKGDCVIHPDSTTHTTEMCFVKQKRLEFIHPLTGVKGITQAQCCPKHPKG